MTDEKTNYSNYIELCVFAVKPLFSASQSLKRLKCL